MNCVEPLKLPNKKLQVLQLVSEGLIVEEIAKHMGISIKTVQKHKGWLFEYFKVHNSICLIRKAFQLKVLDFEVWTAQKPPAPPKSEDFHLHNRFDPASIGLSI